MEDAQERGEAIHKAAARKFKRKAAPSVPRVSPRSNSKDYPDAVPGSMSAERAERRTAEARPGGFVQRWTGDAGITLHRDRTTAIRRRATTDLNGPKLVTA